MNRDARFRAPWPGVLIAISLGGTLALVLATAIALAVLPPQPQPLRVAVGALPVAIVLGCLAFMVRGYVVTDRELIIQRLGWANRWPLAQLESARVDPQAMRYSLRLWGNGGLFAFCGWFRNRRLGLYRAFATDPKRSVVLRFRRRTIVVTPEDPAAFVQALRARCPLPASAFQTSAPAQP